MNATTVAVDLAKSVFQLAVADASWRVIETQRLTRTQFERWFSNRDVSLVIMESCGSAHHWARWLTGLGFEVKLLPAQYVRAYVRRNKTDAADATALLEAARASDIRPVRVKSAQVERELAQAARLSPACTTLLSVPGIGLLTATAMVAATSGDVSHFKDARHFASWFGLTPKEYSSGNTRQLGRISKRGDRYLRMLLTHGARSVLRAAAAARTKGRDVDGIRRWALELQGRSNHNKATCALANKLARVCYATLRDKQRFDEKQPLSKKMNRQAFAMPA